MALHEFRGGGRGTHAGSSSSTTRSPLRRSVVLERARRTNRAAEIWQGLARLFATIAPNDRFFLPACRRCAERDFGFAPN